ncbi:chloride channel protein [Donghicola mangrovi]|uniref:Chloride channel protein n=1 Tax=Donghicola mangrovi TaxID=2729614 RepID=A0A850Q954_9RHOB|nr:chloride channel protein [Donghicola mangrovi]NVO23498.1 chloride channel protein [Donghicola mangrovi]
MGEIRESYAVIVKKGPSQFQFWLIALIVGVVSGAAAVGFRIGIELLQSFLYRTTDINHLHTHLGRLSWMWIVLIPTLGGLAVGLILHRFTPDGRVRSVADVIEGAALHRGRVEMKEGLASALASLLTLSSGGSSGREGPVVHLAGVIATRTSEWIKADGITGRNLLGCAVAAAVSASFNAPIAGALFALEVVLRHFAIHAFAPIVVASVAGTVVSRLAFGDVSEFVLSSRTFLQFYLELPAFFILGLVSGLVAVVLMRSIFWADQLGNRVQAALDIPGWARPMAAGLLLGVIALAFPHIIGVGYETTARALAGRMLLEEAIVLAALKVLAVSITMAGRMGGGVFSPALMVGGLTGLAYGLIATGVFPDVSGEPTLYALAGMGAVAAAVLGAPISTTLIIFELTGDWHTGLAVMVAVSMSTALSSRMVAQSFFLTLLARRNLQLAAGPQAYLLGMYSVNAVMRPLDHEHAAPFDQLEELAAEGTYVTAGQTLTDAMQLFDRTGAAFIPVMKAAFGDQPATIIGAVFQVDALRTFNRALAATAAEEHS